MDGYGEGVKKRRRGGDDGMFKMAISYNELAKHYIDFKV